MIKVTKLIPRYRRRPSLSARAQRAIVACQRIALMRANAIKQHDNRAPRAAR